MTDIESGVWHVSRERHLLGYSELKGKLAKLIFRYISEKSGLLAIFCPEDTHSWFCEEIFAIRTFG